jgi:hypothetical protein
MRIGLGGSMVSGARKVSHHMTKCPSRPRRCPRKDPHAALFCGALALCFCLAKRAAVSASRGANMMLLSSNDQQ